MLAGLLQTENYDTIRSVVRRRSLIMSELHGNLFNSQSRDERFYYSIAEVSEILGVKPHILRYWEQEFEAVRPKRTPRGVRRYRKEDVETLKRIKRLVWTEGYTVDGAKKRLDEEQKGEARPRNTSETLELIDQIEQGLWRILDTLDSGE